MSRLPCLVLLSAVLLGAAARAQAPASSAPIRLSVRVPANATLIIDGHTTASTGPVRRFESPPVELGKTYTYYLNARWTEAGQQAAIGTRVQVRAGKINEVDLVAKYNEMQAKAAANRAANPKTRAFLFTYAGTVTGLGPGKEARVWVPLPPTNEHQEVTIESKDLPAELQTGTEEKHGNRIGYFAAKAGADGTVPFAITYRVQRREVNGDGRGKGLTNEEAELFLKPDEKVPIGGKPLTLLAGLDLPRDQMKLGKVLYDVVNNHMRYSKEGVGWGQGDAVWACDSKFGNCSDFHSLFISLARSKQMPAKFVMGFPLPEQRGAGEVGGYHCWAWFRPEGRGWLPVDISEADKNPKLEDYYFGNLTEDRVAFSTGRDLTLVPKQDGPPLNFLIYPYVEVDGKPYAADKVQRRFSFKDVGMAGK
jgi:uncharacterized protein (TIGR03000 family)